jgi:arylamine N-acetyltransferase
MAPPLSWIPCYNVAMQVLMDFMAHFGLPPDDSPRTLIESMAAAFARLPYENITKIIKRAEAGSPEKARRSPSEVISGHIAWGTGGTCFSLTSALRHLVRSLGWEAEYILADRPYGQNTHCALILWIDGAPHLLDPGFLITRPVPLQATGGQIIKTGFNTLILAREDNKNGISLSTLQQGAGTYRLTYKILPPDEAEFLKAWDASFSWDMMHYPLLTHTSDSKQLYLRGSRFQIRGTDSIHRQEIPPDDLVSRIASEFHIRPSIVAHAVSILKDRGYIHGKTSGC